MEKTAAALHRPSIYIKDCHKLSRPSPANHVHMHN